VNFYVQLFCIALVVFTRATAMAAMTDFLLWASLSIIGLVAAVYISMVSSCLNNLMSRSTAVKGKKVKSDYIIFLPKVDQRAGLLRLPHLGIYLPFTRANFFYKLK